MTFDRPILISYHYVLAIVYRSIIIHGNIHKNWYKFFLTEILSSWPLVSKRLADKYLLYISVEKWHHFIFFSPIPTHRQERRRVVQKCFNCTFMHFWRTQKITILKHSFPIIFSISHKYVRILALAICKNPWTKRI